MRSERHWSGLSRHSSERRSECTDDEKKSFAANVVPMCMFGCDDLFERGHIFVGAGKVRIAENKPVTKTVITYLESIKGNACDRWSKQTRPYFEWQAHFHKPGVGHALEAAAGSMND